MISINPKRIKEPELVTRGLLLHRAGEWSRAMDVYAQVLKKHPDHVVAKYLVGLLWEAVGEPQRCVDLMTEVVRQKPNFHEAHFNRAVALQWLGRLEEARAGYEKTLKINPRFGAAHINLGNALLALGEHEAAIRSYDRGAELRPDNAEGQHNRSFVHLLRGRWTEGWADYEQRWFLPGHAMSNPLPPGVPRWQGESLEGKTILVLHEQGAGDTLMMLRYVPGLLFLGARCILRVPGPLMRLVSLNFPDCPVEEYIHPDNPRPPTPWPQCDYVIPFMSLPGRFGTMPDTVPFSDGPYLIAPSSGPSIHDQARAA